MRKRAAPQQDPGEAEEEDSSDEGGPAELDDGFDADAEGGLSSSSGGDDEGDDEGDGADEARGEGSSGPDSDEAGGEPGGIPPAAAPGASRLRGEGANAAAAAAAGAAGEPDSELDLDLDAQEGPSSGDEDDDSGPGSSDPEEGASGSGSDGGGGGGGGQQQPRASFLEGGKSASFAKAFAKIMDKPAKGALAAGGGAGAILSESATLAKRKAEVQADEAAARAAKRQRQEMRKRGHAKVPRKGEDPAADAREKQLQKLATRGVVLLFNAVNKAQRKKREAEAAGTKGAKDGAAKLTKAGFFAELKAGARAVPGSEQLVPAASGAARAQQQQQQQQQGGQGGAGWDVLGESFPGLTGGSKMKEWDKAAPGASDDEPNGQALAGSDDGDSGGEGW